MNRSSNALPASFKDPDGYIFEQNNTIYRQVNYSAKDNFDYFIDSGLRDKLTNTAKTVSFDIVEDPRKKLESTCYKVLLPQQLPFISYPYEWSFGQFKDSALLTLDIALESLEYGMILKDATPFNIQLVDGCLKHIDTLSFDRYKQGSPWVAYKQFCESFLAPLVLMSKVDSSFNKTLIINLSGIPLNLVDKIVPFSKKLNFGFILHIYIHALNQRLDKNKTSRPTSPIKIETDSLKSVILNLKNFTKSLSITEKKSFWSKYYLDNNYTDASFAEKIAFVEKLVSQLKPKVVWDIGANTGVFSEIAAMHSKTVVAIDNDHHSIDCLYKKTKFGNNKNIYPIIADITNPTPAVGWDNQERLSLLSRGPADLVLSLALIHHLAIANNVPIAKIAKLFSKIGKHLIVEFVPKTDSQVQRLLANRMDVFSDYTQENFEEEFGKEFNIKEKFVIKGSERFLYFMELLK